jgi:hypothetical protein
MDTPQLRALPIRDRTFFFVLSPAASQWLLFGDHPPHVFSNLSSQQTKGAYMVLFILQIFIWKRLRGVD